MGCGTMTRSPEAAGGCTGGGISGAVCTGAGATLAGMLCTDTGCIGAGAGVGAGGGCLLPSARRRISLGVAIISLLMLKFDLILCSESHRRTFSRRFVKIFGLIALNT